MELIIFMPFFSEEHQRAATRRWYGIPQYEYSFNLGIILHHAGSSSIANLAVQITGKSNSHSRCQAAFFTNKLAHVTILDMHADAACLLSAERASLQCRSSSTLWDTFTSLGGRWVALGTFAWLWEIINDWLEQVLKTTTSQPPRSFYGGHKLTGFQDHGPTWRQLAWTRAKSHVRVQYYHLIRIHFEITHNSWSTTAPTLTQPRSKITIPRPSVL